MKSAIYNVLIFSMLFLFVSPLFSQAFLWAEQVELLSIENSASILWLGNDVEKDSEGNVFMSGNFVGTQKFGDSTLTSTGPIPGFFSDDGFIAKYSPEGEFLWVETFPTTLLGNVYDIEIDDNDNIYALMSFIDTIMVMGNQIIADEGFVIAKIDKNKNLLWYNTITRDGSQNFMFPGTLEISGTSVFVTGLVQDEVMMDGVVLNPDRDVVLVSINSQDGSYQWSKNTSNNTGGLATDTDGNVYWATTVNGFIDNFEFGGVLLDLSKGSVMVLAKYDAAGNSIWTKTINNGIANPGFITEVDVDPISGDLYAAGTWGDTLTIDGMEVIGSSLSSLGGLFWLAKFNSAGTIQWIKTSGIQPNTSGGVEHKFIHLETSPTGGVFVSTEHSGAGLILGEGDGEVLFDNLLDGFVAKYSSNGELSWVQKIFCTGIDCTTRIRGLTAVGGDQVVISGAFSTTLDLGDVSLTGVVPGTVEQPNIFLTKLDGGLSTDLENIPTKQLQFHILPNPTSGFFQINIEEEQIEAGHIEVYDMVGNILLSQQIQGNTEELYLSQLPQGTYLLRLLGENYLGVKLLFITR